MAGQILQHALDDGIVQTDDRLTEEGVPMINGKVDMKKYRWEPGLDELLWKPSSMWDEE